MLFSTSSTTKLAFVIAMISGIARALDNAEEHTIAPGDVFGGLMGTTSDEKWENSEEDGNVRIAIEDETFNWGTTPPWEVLEKIKEHCSIVGCHSNDVLTVGTEIISGFNKQDRELELSVQASFSENDALGSLDDLVELAKAAAAVNYEVKETSYDSGRSCERPGSSVGCNPLNEGSEPTQYKDQYYQFSQIHVRVDEGTGPTMLVKIGVKDQELEAGWCAGLLGAGSALAGAVAKVPAPVGSAFSLGSLICGAL